MSSDDGEPRGARPSASKRRHRIVACDMCRQRKLKCNGQQASGKCKNCTDHNWDCTFMKARKKFVPGYVEALEAKVKKLQSLIDRMLPGQDFTHEVGFELTRDNWMLPGVCGAPEPEYPSAFVAGPSAAVPRRDVASSSTFSAMVFDHATPATSIPDDQHSSDDNRRPDTAVKLQNLRTASQWSSWSNHMTSYLGKSFGTGLVKTAHEMCKELAPDLTAAKAFQYRSKVWERPEWLDSFGGGASEKPFRFPEHNLMGELIEYYFAYPNTLYPVLHRPTFEEDVRSGLQFHSRSFGSILLLVCALGSRYSHDQRVLAAGDKTWLSAGLEWFRQTQVLDDAPLASPASHLHVLQATCIGTMYVANISLTHAWMYIGAGIRLAVDIGAHKRCSYGASPTLDDELYKRSFWTLVCLDRMLGTIMGRPCCIQEEDFDLEVPQCCDDEYLTRENPEPLAEQPAAKPSLLSYFIWTLKLTQIQGLALRTLYASTKAKAHYKFQGEEWLTRTIAHFDSLLNSWVDSVPGHLRWDPTRTDDVFFIQSAYLYSLYYITQIIVHRSFISAPREARSSFPSLAICSNAARSLTRVADVVQKRKKDQIGGLSWMLQIAGVVTLVSLGHARLGNLTVDHKQAMMDVDLIISMLRECGTRWRWSARQAEVVESLRVLGETSPGEDLSAVRRKRTRREDYPGPSSTTERQQDALYEPLPALPSHAPTYDISSAMDWNAPSVFGRNVNDELGPNASAYPTEGLHLQNNEAVFGSVDFDALFGLGETGLEGLRPWSPLPFDVAPSTAPFTDPFQGSSDGVGLGSESWSDMNFDIGLDNWQWTPSQHGTSHS